jgi:thiol-disulfide isomerase/thioredoxin
MIADGLVFSLAAETAERAKEVQPSRNEEAAPQIDDKVKAVVTRLGEFFKTIQALQVSMKVGVKTVMPDAQEAMDYSAEVTIARPNKFLLAIKGPETQQITSDGKQLYTYAKDRNVFVQEDAPENFADEETGLDESAMQLGPIFDLMTADPAGKLLNGVSKAVLGKPEVLDGVEYERLLITQDDVEFDMLVSTGEKPTIRRLSFDPMRAFRASLSEEMREEYKSASIAVRMDFEKWVIDPKLPEATFTFTVPEGAKRVETLSEDEDAAATELIGKPAPEFVLALLDGGKAELAKHKGKEVVILDFWATWCGPCRALLPKVVAAAESLKARGVVLYAVNIEESPEEIREFLKETNLRAPVALDVESKVATRYMVTGIPQTVIIDKEGVVRVVHIGAEPNLGETLVRQVEAILAGKDPAEPKPAN